jgi:hypothetical protein
MSESARPTSTCPNCGAARSGAFCPRCGQNDKDYLRSVHGVASEMLRETFELDSRLLRTLWSLVAKPGHLTREFAKGRRASYMSPVRLYLVVSLIFFFVMSLAGDFEITVNGKAREDLREAWEEIRSDPDFLAVYERMNAEDRAVIRERFGLTEEEIAQLNARLTDAEPAAETDVSEWELELSREAMVLGRAELRDKILDGMPVAMFFLLPLFAVLMKLFYPRRYYTEHFVFGLHLHSFLFLVFTVIMLFPESAEGSIEGAWAWLRGLLLFWGLVYVFLMSKRVYAQPGFVTGLKLVAVASCYVVLLGVAIVGSLVLTLLL